MADDADRLARLDVEGDVLEHRLAVVVGERHLLEGDVGPGRHGQVAGALHAVLVAPHLLLDAVEERRHVVELLVGGLQLLPVGQGPHEDEHDGAEGAEVLGADGVEHGQAEDDQDEGQPLVQGGHAHRQELRAEVGLLYALDEHVDAGPVMGGRAVDVHLLGEADGLTDAVGQREGPGGVQGRLLAGRPAERAEERKMPTAATATVSASGGEDDVTRRG